MKHPGGRPPLKPGEKSHRNDHLTKQCECPRRRWAKCPHCWHFNFKYGGVNHRFSLHKLLGKPRTYPMSRTEAEGHRDKLIVKIREGTFTDPNVSPPTTPTDERLTFDDVATRYADYYAQQSWRGEKRRAHRVPLLKKQLALLGRTRIPAAKNTTVRLGDKPFASLVTGDIDAFCEAHRAHMAEQERHRRDRLAKIAAGDTSAKKIAVSPERPRARGGEIGLNRHLGTFRALFNFAIRKGFYDRANPFLLHGQSVVAFADEQARNRRLVGDEEARLLAAMDSERWTHLRAATICAIETGMRKGELLSLTWAAVTFDREERPRYIDLVAGNTKTNEPRRVYITPRLADVLEARRYALDGELHPPTAFVFGNSVGEKFESVKTGWTSACRKAGIKDLHFHDLRRTFGSRLLERHASLMTVSRLLGHKLLTTTNTYLKPSESLIEQEHQRLFPWPAAKRRTAAKGKGKGKASAAG